MQYMGPPSMSAWEPREMFCDSKPPGVDPKTVGFLEKNGDLVVSHVKFCKFQVEISHVISN